MRNNSNTPTTEEAKQAARELTLKLMADGYKQAGFYPITSVNGEALYYRVRLDHPNGSKEIRPISFIDSNWVMKEPKFPNGKPLYNLHEIATHPDEKVWIVEGEKCVDALSKLELLATTSGSATSAGAADWSALSGRNVIIWPDHDDSGLKYAIAVTKQLMKIDCDVKWVDISKLGWSVGSVGSDAVDLILLYPEASKDDIESLPIVVPEVNEPSADTQESDTKASTFDKIASSCELFHSPDRKCFATVPINSHKETWPLKSSGFEDWFAGRYYQEDSSIPRSQVLSDCIGALQGKARYEGDELPVFTRLAKKDRSIYLDLGNDKWGVVEITSESWNVIKDSPVKFIRPNSLLSLPIPKRGGSINELKHFINVEDDDLILVIGFLLFCFSHRGPFPILIVQGEQGSAKSTFCRIIRKLIDPSTGLLRSTPKNEQDLMIAAQNGWLLGFDNLSRLTSDMSDSLCRLASGGGLSTRQLYTNNEESIFDAARPICLNGITEFATRDDLLDRALIIKLPSIPSGKRKEESLLWTEFNEAYPRLLGALLDGVSSVMKNLSEVKLADPPRMADFARFVTAAEPALGWSDGAFMEAYIRNRDMGRNIVLESDSVAQAILNWNPDNWSGTATELLTILESHIPDSIVRSQFWPKIPSTLSSKLKRLQPAFRESGFNIEWTTNGKGNSKRRIINIDKVNGTSSDPSDHDGAVPF